MQHCSGVLKDCSGSCYNNSLYLFYYTLYSLYYDKALYFGQGFGGAGASSGNNECEVGHVTVMVLYIMFYEREKKVSETPRKNVNTISKM